jgi:ketosteroid isomerase-like protein
VSSAADDNQELIRKLYDALGRRDGDAMAAFYSPTARFHDPVFGELNGSQAGDMWRMLAGRSRDLKVELAEHEADEREGRGRWIARYTFTPTGRAVVNEGNARFRFEDGRIVEHVDRFSFYRWARQALGPMGILMGWAPPLRLALRRRALEDLERFSRKRAGGAAESPNPGEGAP